jgi:PadR family transcriptional regulator PadR
MQGWVTQLRKGLVELSVLHVLRRGESYGYEIVQALNDIDALAVSESTVYPVLARLRAEGLVRVREAASSEGPPRRYFSLTPQGRLRLAELSEHWDLVVEAIRRLRAPSGKGQG